MAAALERFTRSIADADRATNTLAAWCGEPPTTRIHTREEAVALPCRRELASRYRAGDRERSLN